MRSFWSLPGKSVHSKFKQWLSGWCKVQTIKLYAFLFSALNETVKTIRNYLGLIDVDLFVSHVFGCTSPYSYGFTSVENDGFNDYNLQMYPKEAV